MRPFFPSCNQAVRQLEEQLRVVLLTRTTRSVSLIDAGRKLVESGDPGVAQALAAVAEAAARSGEAVGRLRLSVPHAAVPYVVSPVLPKFRARRPRVVVEVVVEDRVVDIVAKVTTRGCGCPKRSSATWCKCVAPIHFGSWSWALLAISPGTGHRSARKSCCGTS